MKLGIRHKLSVAFVSTIGLVLIMGLLVDRAVRRYDGAVKGISRAGWEIRAAKEVLNHAREMRVIRLALPGETTGLRVRSLLDATHAKIQDRLERLTESGAAWKDLAEACEQYCAVVQASTPPFQSSLNSPDGQLVPLLDALERSVYTVIEGRLEYIQGLYKETMAGVRFDRVLRLPESYHRVMGELVSTFEHIFVYDEIWAEVLELQFNTFSTILGSDPEGGDRVGAAVENLNLWLESELRDELTIPAIRAYRGEERDFFLRIQTWVNGYPDRLMRCTELASADPYDCFLDSYERVAAIQSQIVQHSLNEAGQVEETMSMASESIASVARTYTLIFVGICLLAGVMAFFLTREVLGPIKDIRKAFERIGEGRFNYRIAKVREDEFGRLEEGFNAMAAAVERRDHELTAARIDLENLALKIQNYSQDLEQEVRKRTTELLRAYEDLKRNDRLKSEFIANMSHELRTPLNSIIGFSKVILKGIDGPITEKQKEDLLLVNQSGRHLLNLITQILDFSKLEAGRLELRLETVDLEGVADEAVSSLRPLVSGKPIDFGYVCSTPGLSVQADRLRLLQIVMNLLSNALKFTDHGAVRLEIRPWDASDTLAPSEPVAFDHGVLLSVTDTGIGIPKESSEVIFQKFRQVDGSSTRAYGGTGLGLAITRELVVMHGGYIWYTSSVGAGSTFFVLLPLEGSPPAT